MMTSRGAGFGIGIHDWNRSEAQAVETGTDIPYLAGTEAKSILGSHGVASRMKVSRSAAAEKVTTLTNCKSQQVIELDREALGGPIQQYLAEKAGATKVTVPQARLLILRRANVKRALADHESDSQIYIKGQNIGGCSDLKKLQQQGKLKDMLAQA